MRYSKVHIFVVSLLFFQFPLFVFGSDDSHDSGVIVENPHPPPPPPPPTRSKDLKQIIRELEESDYGGYGSWGNFQIRREFREKKSKDLDEQRRRQSLLERDSRWSKGGDEHYSVGNAASEEGDNEERRQLVPSFSSSSSSKEVEGKSQLADYYKPQNSRELMLLLDKASLRREAAADSSRIVSVASFARLASLFLLLSLSSFLAVAPRQLPTELYNLAYKANLLRVMGTLLWPAGILLLLFRHEDADVNLMITTFTSSFLFSYPSLCLLEKIIATCIRLAILS